MSAFVRARIPRHRQLRERALHLFVFRASFCTPENRSISLLTVTVPVVLHQQFGPVVRNESERHAFRPSPRALSVFFVFVFFSRPCPWS